MGLYCFIAPNIAYQKGAYLFQLPCQHGWNIYLDKAVTPAYINGLNILANRNSLAYLLGGWLFAFTCSDSLESLLFWWLCDFDQS